MTCDRCAGKLNGVKGFSLDIFGTGGKTHTTKTECREEAMRRYHAGEADNRETIRLIKRIRSMRGH